MATLAFFAIGSAIGAGSTGIAALGISGAALGGAIGGLIGSFVDQALIIPALMGKTHEISGPQIDDLQAQTANEGADMKFLLGERVRVAGEVIWLSDLITETNTDTVGGGLFGLGGQEVTTYTYFVHVAVSVSGTDPDPGEIFKIKRIWADARVIYRDAEDLILDITANNLSAKRKRIFYAPVLGGPHTDDCYLVITAPAPPAGDDLTQFQSGVNVTVSGFSFNIDYTGTFRCEPVTIDGVACAKITGGGTAFDISNFESGGNVVVSGWPAGANNGTFRCFKSAYDATQNLFVAYLINASAVLDGGSAGVRLRQTTTGAVVTHNVLEIIDAGANMMIVAGENGPDLTTFKVGTNLTVAGAAAGVNNGTWPVVRTGVGVDQSRPRDTYVMVSNAAALSADTGASITLTGTRYTNNGTFRCYKAVANPGGSTSLWLEHRHASDRAAGNNVTLHQETAAFDASVATDIRIYPGNGTQEPDDLIVADRGAALTPAYRWECYVVFEGFALADYSNHLPNFNFQAQPQESLTRAEAIAILLKRTKAIVDADFDASAVNGGLRGMIISGPQPTASMLDIILTAYDIMVEESNGQLVFYDLGEEDIIIVDADHLAAHPSGDQTPPALAITDIAGFDLPQEVGVAYVDPANQYQAGNMRERRIQRVSDTVIDLQIPLTLNAGEARRIARRRLWAAWGDRQMAEFTLPPHYAQIAEGKILTIADGVAGGNLRVRVTDVSRGNDHLLSIKGVGSDEGTFDWRDEEVDDSNQPDPPVYVPSALRLLLMQVAPLRDLDLLTPGYYFGVCTADPAALWAGASIFISSDNSTYALLTNVPVEAVLVEAVTALGTGTPGYFNTSQTVRVRCMNGTLSSASQSDVLAGANRLYLGGEIIAFLDADLVDTDTYDLSTLLRGLRDTEDAIDTHQIGELGALLAGAVRFQSMATSEMGQSRYFKPVALGDDVANVPSILATLLGATVRPFPPTYVRGDRDGSNNLTITGIRRTRANTRLFSTPAPLIDPEERYELDILDAPGGTVLRTIEVSGPLTTVYSAATQTSDGLTPGDLVNLNAHMVNDLYGRSKAEEATV